MASSEAIDLFGARPSQEVSPAQQQEDPAARPGASAEAIDLFGARPRESSLSPYRPPPQAPIYDKIIDLANDFGEGFNRGLAQALGMPVDLVNMGLGKIGVPVSRRPFGGSESIRVMMGEVGIQSDATGPASRIGEEIGAGTAMLAGGFGLAARGIQGGQKVLRSVVGTPTRRDIMLRAGVPSTTRIAERSPLIQPLVDAPGRAVAVETGLAAAGGAGAAIAQELAPGNQGAEIGGTIAGSVAPTLAGATVRGVGALGRAAGAGFSKKVQVRDLLSMSAFADPETLIKRLEDAPEGATTAQATGDPGLLALEGAVARHPETYPGWAHKREGQQTILREGLGRSPTGDLVAGVDIARVSEIAEARLGRAMRELDDNVDDAVATAQAALESARSGTARADAGKALRERLRKLKKQGRAKESDKWEKVLPPEEVGIESLQTLARTVRDQTGKAGRELGGNIPDRTIKFILDMDLEKAGDELVHSGTQPLQELVGKGSVRSTLLQQIADESAKDSPNASLIHNLERLQRGVETVVDTFRASMDDDVVGAAYDEAKRFSVELNNRFTRGKIAGVLGSTGARSVRVQDSDVVREFFPPNQRGAEEAADDLVRALGESADTEKVLQETVLRDFVETVFGETTDEFKTAVAKRWVKRHSTVLQKYPGIRDSVRAIINDVGEVERRGLLRDRGRKEIESSALRFAMGDNYDIDKMMPALLQSKTAAKDMRGLVRQLGPDPDALGGLKRLFWGEFDRKIAGAEEFIADAGSALEGETVKFMKPDVLRRFVNKNEPAMIELFGRPHVNRIKAMVSLSDMFNRSVLGGRAPGGSDSIQRAMRGFGGVSIPQILGRAYNVQRGVVSKFFVTAELSSRLLHNFIGNQTRANTSALLNEALMNPEIAKTLLMKATPRTEREIVTRLRGHLVSIGQEDDQSGVARGEVVQ